MSPDTLVAHVDDDWRRCEETRKPMSGWIIANKGTPIAFGTRNQSIIEASSPESEYVDLYECAKHVNWMRKLYWEMIHKERWPVNKVNFESTVIRIDSEAAKTLALNKKVMVRNKYIDPKVPLCQNRYR